MAASKRRLTLRTLLGYFAALACLPACTSPGDFHCTQSRQCGGEQAFCEPEGRCSFAVSPTICASGRRYGEAAGESSSQCVAPSCQAPPPMAIAAGDRHACVLRTGGSVACWGDNDRGQLGDGSTVPRSAPVAVTLPGTITEVVTGGAHSCALRSTGLVYCWGANDHGQLGDGSQVDERTPVSVRLGAPATHLAAGADFTCAALSLGDVTCWGANDSAQCGTPSPSIILTPSVSLGLTKTKGLAAGHHHACAFDDAGRLICWGNNTVGQLGGGTTSALRAPTVVTALAGQPVTGLAAGDGHTCALVAGRLFCWGDNTAGQLGLGNNTDTASPGELTSFHDVSVVSAGSQHTCVRRADASLWCWGGNSAGQLGEGTTSSLALPVPVGGHLRGLAVAAGGDFSCVLASDGALSCWGDNRHGQLALGNHLFDGTPGVVAGVSAVKAVAVGGSHVCVTAGDTASVSCWGGNQAGQLGAGDFADRTLAAPTKIPLEAEMLAAGASHTCAVESGSGALYCWGRGTDGQLGNDSALDARLPVAVKDATPAVSVAAGAAHSCAVHGDGTVVCWGKGDRGQIGDGAGISRATPVVVPGLLAMQLALGDAHACALARDGGVACWGRGSEGQLGRGTNDDSLSPVPVALPPTKMLVAGAFHTCALAEDGTVRCWGDGAAGQLGDARRLALASPWLVPDLEHVQALEAGRAHTCAVLGEGSPLGRAGEVVCWGDRQRGQSGTAASSVSSQPSLVEGAADTTAVGLGGDETCVVSAAGTLKCFGDDESGQLGRGGELQFLMPQPSRLCP